MQTPAQPTIDRIDAFQKATGMSDRQLSLALGNDHKLVRRIREGRSNTRTMQRVLEYIAEHQSPSNEAA